MGITITTNKEFAAALESRIPRSQLMALGQILPRAYKEAWEHYHPSKEEGAGRPRFHPSTWTKGLPNLINLAMDSNLIYLANFFADQGFQWRTVVNGANAYVQHILDIGDDLRLIILKCKNGSKDIKNAKSRTKNPLKNSGILFKENFPASAFEEDSGRLIVYLVHGYKSLRVLNENERPEFAYLYLYSEDLGTGKTMRFEYCMNQYIHTIANQNIGIMQDVPALQEEENLISPLEKPEEDTETGS